MELNVDPVAVKRRILHTAYTSNKGHIGSALSVADIASALVSNSRGLGTRDPARDRLIFSKGHAATALYAALTEAGIWPESTIRTYCSSDSLVATHPHHSLNAVDFSTGSLGQGITFGVGSALASQLSHSGFAVRVLLSDSEVNEGSTWEAMQIAAHHRLEGLVVVLDQNGQQALGHTRDICNTDWVGDAWAAAGWEVVTVDGHDAVAVSLHLNPGNRPKLIVAKTISGHGVDFMEGKVEWHYLPMSEEQYARATSDLGV